MRLRSERRILWVDPSREASSEQGAVLVLIALFLSIFMVVAAFAVDLSALERRGQTLQNTADAAALAGVATWIETGDQAAAWNTIEDIITQNGVSGSDVDLGVSFDDDNHELTVVVTDTDPDDFLGSFVPGYDPHVERAATAQLEDCSTDCAKQVEIPRPPNPIPATGSGDGYRPISVGSRFYGINHDNDTIACVDRNTETACWTDREAYAGSNAVSGSVSHHAVVGDKIWWVAQETSRLGLFCWDTVGEDPCLQSYTVANLARSNLINPDLGGNFRQRGGGVVEVGGNLYAFTDDHRVHCFVPEVGVRCTGYASGVSTSLALAGFPALDPAKDTSGSNIDRIVHEGNDRIYHTLHVRATDESEDHYDTGVWLQCFDTRAATACSGFTPHKLHEQGARQEGRLFFYRAPDRTPLGVCSTGLGLIECTDLAGNERTDLEGNLDDLANVLPPASQYGGGMGVHTWHQPTNRLFMVAPRRFSVDHCWDFDTASYCGAIPGQVPGLGETQDYGFWYEEASNCIFALGHRSIFWAFEAHDLSRGCPGAMKSTNISPCSCNGERAWGRIRFEFDVGEESPFTVLNIQVVDRDGAILFPTTGEWASMLHTPGGELDLADLIPTTYDEVIVRVYAEADDETPWIEGDPPVWVFKLPDERPRLTN